MARDKTIKTSQVGGWYYDLILCGREGIYMLHHRHGSDCPNDADALDATTEEAAIVEFNAKMDEFRREDEAERGGPYRDWEAQALYDEMYGTINGYDPAIVAHQEAFPYGE